jgi:hypothetical protein
MAALIRKGADIQKVATSLAKAAISAKDDLLLGAVILKAKQSVLDTLDLDFKHLVADGFPHAAAQFLKRTMNDIGMFQQHCNHSGSLWTRRRSILSLLHAFTFATHLRSMSIPQACQTNKGIAGTCFLGVRFTSQQPQSWQAKKLMLLMYVFKL